MAQALYDGMVEYDDGTPATQSQMAKDVTTFLAWASEPEHDERKKTGLKAMIILTFITGLSLYYKRFRWNVIKSRKMYIDNLK